MNYLFKTNETMSNKLVSIEDVLKVVDSIGWVSEEFKDNIRIDINALPITESKDIPMSEIKEIPKQIAVAFADTYIDMRDTVKLASDIQNYAILHARESKELWIDAKNPPKESGRYWCYVKDINDLGTSYFQWNCYYDKEDKQFRDNHEVMTVTHWTDLLPTPPTK